MGVIVTFDPTAWKQTFPEFSALTDQQATNYFNMATGIHRNDGGGPVDAAASQTYLLNFLTAHFAKLLSATANTSVVGRLSDATEGSVSASFQNDYPPGSAQWFQQTQYGSTYYLAAAPYRTARYLPNPRSPVNAGAWPYGPYGGDGSGWVG